MKTTPTISYLTYPYFFFKTDWKFGIEDLKNALTGMIDTTFDITYAPNLRGEELFKHVQKGVQKKGFSLMNMATDSDDFFLFLIPNCDIEALIAKSEILALKIELV